MLSSDEIKIGSNCYAPLDEEYDTMEKCRTLLNKVFTREVSDKIIRNRFGNNRMFVEQGGRMYGIVGDFPGGPCDLPVRGAVYTEDSGILAVTRYQNDAGLYNYHIYLKKEAGSWKIDSMVIPY